ncbi:MAG: hypothetical protein MRQ13_04525 [Candidatus Midichloria sp.]|nr:hypothetical protein [Candidatus Midichloria sp.]
MVYKIEKFVGNLQSHFTKSDKSESFAQGGYKLTKIIDELKQLAGS